MKKSAIIFLTIFFLVSGIVVNKYFNSRQIIRGIKEKGIVFDNKTSQFLERNNKKVVSEASRQDLENHMKDIKAIDDAWNYIHEGNEYKKLDQNQKSVQSYKKAYDTSRERSAEKAMSGFYLAESYEKLGRYEEAIKLLDYMIQNKELSQMGIQDAKAMISRLLAAKNSKNAA